MSDCGHTLALFVAAGPRLDAVRFHSSVPIGERGMEAAAGDSAAVGRSYTRGALTAVSYPYPFPELLDMATVQVHLGGQKLVCEELVRIGNGVKGVLIRRCVARPPMVAKEFPQALHPRPAATRS